MRTLFALSVVLIYNLHFSLLAYSQALIAGAEEIRVSVEPGGNSHRPAILSDEHGRTWIVWESGSRWYHPDFRAESPPEGPMGYAGAAMYAGNGVWVILHSRDRDYRLLFIRPGVSVDSSGVLFNLRFVRDPSQHGYSAYEDIKSQTLVRTGVGGLFVASRYCTAWYGAGPDINSTTTQMWAVDPQAGDLRKLLESSNGNANGDVAHATQYAASEPMAGSVLILTQSGDVVRSIRAFNLATGQLGADKRIDAVRFWKNDYNNVALRTAADQIDFLYQKENVEGLSIDRIDTTGRLVESMQNNNFSAVNTSDYVAGIFSNGHRLLIWSRQTDDSTGNLFAQLFDSRWQSIGPPRTVNSMFGGKNIRSALSIRNDTATIAWHSNRSGAWHLYMRRFTITQLTDAEQPETMPSTFAVLSPYPNPLPSHHRVVTIPVVMSGPGNLYISVLDCLGHEIQHSQQGVQSGQHLIQLRILDLCPGMYMLRIADGWTSTLTRLVVL